MWNSPDMIRVTLTKILEAWWGADETWEDGGPELVKKLLHEDLEAVVEDMQWTIEKVE
jgi:hypothetical protein